MKLMWWLFDLFAFPPNCLLYFFRLTERVVCIKCKCTLTFELHRLSTLANIHIVLAGGLFTLHVDKLWLASSYLDRLVRDRLVLMVDGLRVTTTIGWIAAEDFNGKPILTE